MPMSETEGVRPRARILPLESIAAILRRVVRH